MTKTRDLTKLAFSGAITAAMLATGCAASKGTHPPATVPAAARANAAASDDAKATPTYVTAKEVEAMAPCTATFAKRLSEFSGSFTTTDGKSFVLGDDRGEQWVWQFVGALKEGGTYALPESFVNYMHAPHYVTAKEIAEMPPCTATLASRTPCSSFFLTADGKWFGVGDPGSGAQVSQFIWSLSEGDACTFPDAFLDYQRQHHAESDEE